MATVAPMPRESVRIEGMLKEGERPSVLAA
jgi:hypothetical protein